MDLFSLIHVVHYLSLALFAHIGLYLLTVSVISQLFIMLKVSVRLAQHGAPLARAGGPGTAGTVQQARNTGNTVQLSLFSCQTIKLLE